MARRGGGGGAIPEVVEGTVKRLMKKADVKVPRGATRTRGGGASNHFGSGSPTGSSAVPTGSAGHTYALTYKPGWSAAQRADADAKVAALNRLGDEGKLVKTSGSRGSKGASAHWDSYHGKGTRGTGQDVDHTHELQLGGDDDITNMNLLDSSVNRSLGSQINHHVKDLPEGSPVRGFTLGERK
jgi:hypothetical protein